MIDQNIPLSECNGIIPQILRICKPEAASATFSHFIVLPQYVIRQTIGHTVYRTASDHFSSVLVRGGTMTDFREAFGVKTRDPEPS